MPRGPWRCRPVVFSSTAALLNGLTFAGDQRDRLQFVWGAAGKTMAACRETHTQWVDNGGASASDQGHRQGRVGGGQRGARLARWWPQRLDSDSTSWRWAASTPGHVQRLGVLGAHALQTVKAGPISLKGAPQRRARPGSRHTAPGVAHRGDAGRHHPARCPMASPRRPLDATRAHPVVPENGGDVWQRAGRALRQETRASGDGRRREGGEGVGEGGEDWRRMRGGV